MFESEPNVDVRQVLELRLEVLRKIPLEVDSDRVLIHHFLDPSLLFPLLGHFFSICSHFESEFINFRILERIEIF